MLKTGGLDCSHEGNQDSVYAGVVQRTLKYLHRKVAEDAALLATHQQLAELHAALETLGIEDETELARRQHEPAVKAIFEQSTDQRERMLKQAWRYHIWSPSGLVHRLQPLADVVESGEALTGDAAEDALIVALIRGQVPNDSVDEMQLLRDSFGADDIELCEDEQGNAECGCQFCTELFDEVSCCDCTALQEFLAAHYLRA